METIKDNEKLWQAVLSEIEISVSKANFSTWFKNTFISRLDGGTVYLSVPNAFVRDWLLNKYHKAILRGLRNGVDGVRSVEYIITQKNQMLSGENNNISVSQKTQIFSDQPQLRELEVNQESGLNPRYTFNSFIVGSFNELAHAAARGVIKNPGIYNPLFIYGGTGVGKTHLTQAVGNEIKKNDDSKKIYYLTTEQFTVEFLDSLQTNKMYLFKEKYRKYDVLIMDDIHFIAGKEKTQDELFHLFNSLYENNRQIIFSSDTPPKQINHLEERLCSRFEGGMVVDINQPDFESRIAILKSKLLNDIDFSPSEEVVEYVASVIQDNIRELEGALNSIVCQSQLKKKMLSLQEVRTLIKNCVRPQKTISIKDVVRTVAEFYNIEEKRLYEKTRRKEVVKPRQIVMYILREEFGTSFPYIGQKLGGRDHTTVIHACDKIKRDMKDGSLLNQELGQIKTILYKNSNSIVV